MKNIAGFESVAFCRHLSGVLLAEAIESVGRGDELYGEYHKVHTALFCIFTRRRGKNNWSKQRNIAIADIARIVTTELGGGWQKRLV